jgi:hypothetical protein
MLAHHEAIQLLSVLLAGQLTAAAAWLSFKVRRGTQPLTPWSRSRRSSDIFD